MSNQLYSSYARGKDVMAMKAVVGAQSADPEQEALSLLLNSWQVILGTSCLTAGDALTAIALTVDQSKLAAKAQLLGILAEFNHDRPISSARALGRVLGYRKDRIVGGRCLKAKLDPLTNQKLWSVQNAP